MEKEPNFVFDYSLEEMSLRRVVANLWTETDIVVTIQNFPVICPHTVDHRITNQNVAFNKVKTKLSKLVIPASLKERMMDTIKPIGNELMRWKTFHDSVFESAREDLLLYMMKRVVWTSAGTIDYRRTAEIILSLDSVNVRIRYTIACLYCLVDYIPVLWNKLPKHFKNFYLPDPPEILHSQLMYYFARVMGGGGSELESTVSEPFHEVIQYAFETYARNGNKAATDYFLRKLTTEERSVSLLSAVDLIISDRCTNSYTWDIHFPIERLSEMLRYLLSLLTPAQQMKVVKDRPVEILRCFLDWPCQDLFLKTAKFVFSFLPKEQYDYLLTSLGITIGQSGYYFPILFREFFKDSPSVFKDYFIKYECDLQDRSPYLDEFFDADDAETIRCIFRNVTLKHRVSLLSNHRFFLVLDLLIMEGKSHLVKVCIEEISKCRNDRAQLEETYMGYLEGEDTRLSRLRKRRWKRIFQECNEDKVNCSSKRSYREKKLMKSEKLHMRKRKF